MSIDNPNLYCAMTDAVASCEDELALYGFAVGVEAHQHLPEALIWVETDKGLPGFTSTSTFENVPEFEVWASKTIDAHREVTA